MAKRLADAVKTKDKLRLAWACEANEVFLVLPPSAQAALAAEGVQYIAWSDAALPDGQRLQQGEVVGRFVCSFATQAAKVDRLAAVLATA
jgi:threonine aldolase